ncbi:hypothetical protein AeMF1_010083 [Aphanomyces euteiches]|nr:hypothetical protein AeMF1_010083 [Aphanomyces euteiches]KAH9187851.1 hypothetical protein AeNC1_010173 [Aphanomyces euteiches]
MSGNQMEFAEWIALTGHFLKTLAMAEAPQFFRVNCSHPQVFHLSYVRCYQNHGLKVIRCFPHCCPHMEYRGCGASLSLRVETRGAEAVDTMHAFGRFEIASEAPIADTEIIEWTTFSKDLRSKDNVYGMWLHGVRQVIEDRTVVFHFNKQRTEGWHYEWHGGSSKIKRNELHRFHVYIVQHESETKCKILRSIIENKTTLKKNKTQPQRQKISNDQVVSNAHKLVRIFQFCTAISIDDVPPQVWSAVEERLLQRCAEWSGLGALRSIPIIPPELRQYSEQSWSSSHQIAVDVLLTWFDQTTFELYQRIFQTHRTSGNLRSAYHALLEAVHEHIARNLQEDLDSLDAHLQNLRLSRSNRKNGSMCYDAFVSAFQESAMGLVCIRPKSFFMRYNGQWCLQSFSIRQMDVRPTIYNFFRQFTMVYAMDMRIVENVLFVKSKLKMFPATWSTFHLDGTVGTFHVLPNGDAFGLDHTTFVGDYKAWMEFGTTHLWIYRWPRPGYENCFLLRIEITPSV